MKMPLSLLVMMNIGIVVAAIIQCIAPSSFRPGIFFGVTVDPEFPHTADAQRILWRYRRNIIVMGAVCTAALWLAVPRLTGVAAPLATSALIFIGVGAAIVSMASASRHVRAFAKPHSTIRTVSLVPRKQTLPGGGIPFIGPTVIVIAIRLLLFTRRESMPPETYRNAVILLLVPFVATVFFTSVVWLATFRTRQLNASGPAANQENADRRSRYWLRLGMIYLQTVFFVAIALGVAGIPIFRGPRFVVVVMATWLVFGMAVLVYVLKKRRRLLDIPAGATSGDSTPDECWKWGLVYYNPNDSALVVETRAGRFGCDLNFGNKWSWVVCGVILATPFLVRFFWI
jgi:uncharacterized membrane protein